MAPSFPLSLPALGYDLSEFSLDRQVAGARLRSGGAQRIGRGVDYWHATYRTVRLNRNQYDDLQAFIESLAFGLNTFLAYDVNKPYPRNYPDGFAGLLRPDGTTAFDGTATVTAITATTLSLSDLPPNFVLKKGDWLGLVESSKYALHRFQEDRTASATGTLTLIYLSPAPLSTVFTTAAEANFDKPKALMLLEPEAVSMPWTGPGSGPFVFSASQKVL